MVLAFCNKKGGVGKTSSVINIASALARKGNHVLCVDLDPQANLTEGFGFPTTLDKNIATVLVKAKEIGACIFKNDLVHMLPASEDMDDLEEDLSRMTMREFVLHRALKPVRDKYDFILLDCPPSLGIITKNAIVASDAYLVPMQTEYFSLTGLVKLISKVRRVTVETDTKSQLMGVFFTKHDKRKIDARQISEAVHAALPGHVFQHYIRQNQSVHIAQGKGKDVWSYDQSEEGQSNARVDYDLLSDEILLKSKLKPQYQ